MRLPSNIKSKNLIWGLLPFSKSTAQAIYPNIYFRKEVYNNLKSVNPKPHYVAALKHEQTHIARQRKMGWFKWCLSYIFFPKFRFNEEFEAIKSSMPYLKSKNCTFDSGKTAKYLSGWLYLWCIPYKKAKSKLDRAWKNIAAK